MLTATGRIDGSSKFGKNEKYGFSLLLVLHGESLKRVFWSTAKQYLNLKLRLSVGQTGNQEIGSFVTQSFINSANVVFGDGLHSGFLSGLYR